MLENFSIRNVGDEEKSRLFVFQHATTGRYKHNAKTTFHIRKRNITLLGMLISRNAKFQPEKGPTQGSVKRASWIERLLRQTLRIFWKKGEKI